MHSHFSLPSGRQAVETGVTPDNTASSRARGPGAGNHPVYTETSSLEHNSPNLLSSIAYTGSLFDNAGPGKEERQQQPPSPAGDDILADIKPTLPTGEYPWNDYIYHAAPFPVDQNDMHHLGCTSPETSLTFGAETAPTDFTSGTRSTQEHQGSDNYDNDTWPILVQNDANGFNGSSSPPSTGPSSRSYEQRIETRERIIDFINGLPVFGYGLHGEDEVEGALEQLRISSPHDS